MTTRSRSPLDGGTVLLPGASAGIGLALARRLDVLACDPSDLDQTRRTR